MLDTEKKQALRWVRNHLAKELTAPNPRNEARARRKIRFYDWCLTQEKGFDRFADYRHAKAKFGELTEEAEEAGFKAAGWIDPERMQ